MALTLQVGCEALLDSMEIFIMGHEFGHIIAGHLLDKKVFTHLTPSQRVEEILYSHNSEKEADIHGFTLLLHCMKQFYGFELNRSYRGTELFFISNEVMDKGIMILRTGNPYIPKDIMAMESHPPPSERIVNLRELVKQQFGEPELAPSLMIDKIMRVLWNETEELLIAEYKKGNRPHQRFDHRLESD